VFSNAPLWELPDPRDGIPGEDLIAVGGGLDSGTLISAYSRGLFPMNVPMGPHEEPMIGWWSPDPRGVLALGDMRISRSLAKSCRRFTVTFDTCFEDVVRACADPRRPQGWITEEFVQAYVLLHDRGYAHSVEVWSAEELAGGLYGVEIGGLFAGESMFHRTRDASKVGLVALVERLSSCPGERLIDVQWATAHLRSLGTQEIPRLDYLRMLPRLIAEEPCLS
jgi:leucyl/phenylalanyl-tRNA--protein transferase